VDAVAPYCAQEGTAAAFVQNVDGTPIHEAVVPYVNGFVPHHIGKDYSPHVTIGLGKEDFVKQMKATPYMPFTFKIAGVSVYQLGDFGTAAKILWQDQAREPLASWNDTASKKSIIAFVEKVAKEGSPDFVAVAERIAVFDNDGTLWAEQPMYFQFLFALDRVKALAPQHPEWKTKEPFASLLKGDVKGALAGGERAMLEIVMATHAGMTTEEFEKIVTDWVTTAKHPVTKRLYTQMVYRPMLELLGYLRANGFKTFIVSGGGIEFMRPWAEQVYGIPPEQVVGSSIKTKFELRDGKPVLVRLPDINFIDDKAGKPVGIHQHIGRRPIAAFGNSDGDLQMLQWTAAGNGARFALIVHHTDAEREWAYDRTSSIGKLDKAWDEAHEGLDGGGHEAGLEDRLSVRKQVSRDRRDMKRKWLSLPIAVFALVVAWEEVGRGEPLYSENLTGVEWQVSELSGRRVVPSVDRQQPFIIFDAAKTQASGYAGCNRFFGGYELNGKVLKFGPIGATRRACPDLEEGVETEFLKALDATRGWRIVDGALELLNGDLVLARLHRHQGS
jgi:heat shock protein HslJ/phosphoglycolate phosphatase-like HAD superfamily hydrolase